MIQTINDGVIKVLCLRFWGQITKSPILQNKLTFYLEVTSICTLIKLFRLSYSINKYSFFSYSHKLYGHKLKTSRPQTFYISGRKYVNKILINSSVKLYQTYFHQRLFDSSLFIVQSLATTSFLQELVTVGLSVPVMKYICI